ncbi:MAG: hypothetical protein K2M52_00460 [Paramuribaculum sp.]|nr:hypothetical protein [Paramuribaculum sp.]
MNLGSNNITGSPQRVAINTLAQYIRSLISLVLGLYSTRLILGALGFDDFGIFSLIAGVVAMLSFISTALVASSQRFLSYYSNSPIDFQQKLFGNIVILHILFSIILITILELIKPWLFDGFLNIKPSDITVAEYVYQCAIFMVITSFLYAPFLALLIAHEDIVYSSIVQIIDAVIRLVIAIFITHQGADKLKLYVSLLCSISILDFLAYLIFSGFRYRECVFPKFKHINKGIAKEISNFIFWQIYSTGCTVGRTQGTAIVLNKLFGTIINASFGIAQQVSGAISFVSSSLLNAINPLIIRAEGNNDRERMFDLAMMASKFSTFLLALFVFPLVFNMNIVLTLWLGKVPDGASLFCCVILITSLIDQITAGLITANQAIGNIRVYSLTINTLKLITVPIIFFLLWYGIELTTAIWAYAILELICALCRIPFLHFTGGLNISKYFNCVLVKIAGPLLFFTCAYYIQAKFINNHILILIYSLFASVIYLLIIHRFCLSQNEEATISKLFDKLIHR